MTKKPVKRGRKPIIINYEDVEKYAGMGLTKQEIADSLGYSKTAFYKAKAQDNKIEEAIRLGRSKFKVFLSSELVKQVKNGNVTAAIWLDKTRCGSREVDIADTDNNPTPVSVTIQVEDASS